MIFRPFILPYDALLHAIHTLQESPPGQRVRCFNVDGEKVLPQLIEIYRVDSDAGEMVIVEVIDGKDGEARLRDQNRRNGRGRRRE